MENRLEDPAKIGPAWAAQFIGAVKMIGLHECEQQANLFEFVTGHEAYQEARDERKTFLAAVEKRK